VCASRSVAIWGSCVTRDAFALTDRPALAGLDLVYYGARSSWVSQASVAWPDKPDFGDLAGFGCRMVEEDFAKSIPDCLVAAGADIVVLDLIDERLPLLRHGPTWLTLSDYLLQTPMAAQMQELAVERSGLADRRRHEMFAASAIALAQQLSVRLPQSTFVLHAAPYTTAVDGGGALPEPAAGWARDLNAGQQPLFEALRIAFGPRLVVITPPEDVAMADPGHKWGLSSYHYAERYYDWLLDELNAVKPVPATEPWYPPMASPASAPRPLWPRVRRRMRRMLKG
jgi:hypothetical protein